MTTIRTKKQLAKALEAAGWTVEMKRVFTGSSGRSYGPRGIRTSNGHEAHSFDIRAVRDGQSFDVTADEPAKWAIESAVRRGLI